MIQKNKINRWQLAPLVIGLGLLAILIGRPVGAINQIPDPQPQPGSYGVEATKKQPAPTTAPTITTPGNGASFGSPTTNVNGICQTDLLVQIYSNGVLVGAVVCKGGSFTAQVSLFAGSNDLTAIQYDDLEQGSPESNKVTVTYTDTKFTAFGQIVTLTSSYGRRSSAAGTQLDWPLQLSGGTGPYAFSIDWGDGGKPELKSQAFSGIVTISHTYKTAGIYQVNITVTDVNGVSGFLQVIAVASGKVDGTASASGTSSGGGTSKTTVLWIPAASAVALLIPAYFLGRRSQIVSIRNKMLKDQARQAASETTA